MSGRLRQHEVREVLEDPLVLQCSIDDPQELTSQSDDRLPRPAPRFDLFVVPLQIRAVALRDQSALHQRRAPQLVAAFGDAARALRLVRIANPRHNPEVRRQLALLGKVVDVADYAEQNAPRQCAATASWNKRVFPVTATAISSLGRSLFTNRGRSSSFQSVK